MLSQLSIRDIVLIDRLDLGFERGLSVLTGETGAGKSILLDSLSLALGARGDGGLVRHDEERGQVTAVFDEADEGVLLIDEASLGLSPALATVVFEVVKRICADGTTVLIVEQNVGILPYADRALIMEQGTIVYEGVGDEIQSANLRETYLGT